MQGSQEARIQSGISRETSEGNRPNNWIKKVGGAFLVLVPWFENSDVPITNINIEILSKLYWRKWMKLWIFYEVIFEEQLVWIFLFGLFVIFFFFH